MSEFSSSLYKIAFSYPDEWTVIESKDFGGVQVFLPREEDDEKYSDNLSILIREQEKPLPQNASVLSYISNEIIKSNYESYTNCVLLSLVTRNLKDTPCREMYYVYEDRKRNQLMRAFQIIFVDKNRIFLLTYTAKESNFERYVDQVYSIVDSLEY